MHQVVELGLPHAPQGKLYLEDRGRRVLHVSTDLSSEDTQAFADLETELEKLVGGLHGYDECIIHTKDCR